MRIYAFPYSIPSAPLTAEYFATNVANVATEGGFRAGNGAGQGLYFRNLSNADNLGLYLDNSNVFQVESSLSIDGYFNTKSIRSPEIILTDQATITPDFSTGSSFKVQLGGSRTLGVPSNLSPGQSGFINVFQDSTGSRTLSYAWPFIFPYGLAPTLSTTKFSMDQLTYLVNSYATSTVTISIATPGVVTWTAHGLFSGQRIRLTTTGALPTGLAVDTTYWVNVVNADTFNLSSSLANLQAGTFIATSGTQSGVHTAVNASISINANLGMA